MDKIFIEVRNEKNSQMFLNVNQIASFRQALGNNMDTEITFSGGHTIVLKTQFHELRKILGLDK